MFCLRFSKKVFVCFLTCVPDKYLNFLKKKMFRLKVVNDK